MKILERPPVSTGKQGNSNTLSNTAYRCGCEHPACSWLYLAVVVWRDGGMAQWRSHNCAATTHQDIMVRTAHYTMNGAETFTIFVTTDNSFIVTSF